MIDKFQFDPVDGLQNATAYPDDPGNEEDFREQLQRPLNQVKEYVNSLVDAYAKTEAGRSGAEEIGSEAISGLMDPSNPLQPALTVRKQLQAAQKNIDDIIAGITPDGSVDTEKIADGAVTPDKVSGGVGCNYIRNRIPTTGDNFNLGYKVGDTWTVPDMTLNNLIPHATAITPADWTLQNGSLAGSGSKGTITCGNGLESATAKISIAPIPGHVYALFGALKVTSANAITSISLGADQKAAPVKDTAYNLCEIIMDPVEFKVQITAATAAALNGATVEFDKVCIVDMTADMVGVPFDRAGAIEYFSSHAAFISQEPEYAGMNWYCKGSGVWQSSSQLSDGTKAIYGVENVDDALAKVFSSYPSIFMGELLNNTFVETKTCTNGEVLPNLLKCKNFIVPTGITVTTQPKKPTLIFADNVQIDGVIDADGKGGAGGLKHSGSNAGNGGAGGGNIFIICNEFTGSGKITANGLNGGNAGAYVGNAGLGARGETGNLPDKSTAVGGWCGTGSSGNTSGSASVTNIIWENLNSLGVFALLHPRITGGGGGGGGQNHTSTSTGAYSATGGAGAGGNSGDSPAKNVAVTSIVGGGGGGGGGLIVIVSHTEIPATLTLEAKGGNGGTGSGTSPLTGGGGGGGAIACFSPALNAVTSVAGGLTGTGAVSGVVGIVINTVSN